MSSWQYNLELMHNESFLNIVIATFFEKKMMLGT